MNQLLQEQYERLGISPEVSAFGEKIEASLKQRFEEIDARAEYNQLKVLKAMQDNRVSAECFNTTSGYGYNDLGRDTLEKVYASCFGGELSSGDDSRRIYVTLGQFSIVRLERDTQLLVPVYDYCMPDKECACGDGCEDPCALFRNISFPVGEFFPPNLSLIHISEPTRH